MIAALRMPLERIIVGELRGMEVLTFLRAVKTDHPGFIRQTHASRHFVTIVLQILVK
jgi:Flp pilus assembly CpaF family ATPase|nr:ATPase, T2SS/T4P/T4SS family [Porphyrobacter sp. LM 6]